MIIIHIANSTFNERPICALDRVVKGYFEMWKQQYVAREIRGAHMNSSAGQGHCRQSAATRGAARFQPTIGPPKAGGVGSTRKFAGRRKNTSVTLCEQDEEPTPRERPLWRWARRSSWREHAYCKAAPRCHRPMLPCGLTLSRLRIGLALADGKWADLIWRCGSEAPLRARDLPLIGRS